MTEWDFHNTVNPYPPETLRELAAEFDAADREREAKSMAAKRLSAVEKRVNRLERNSATKVALKRALAHTLQLNDANVADRLETLAARIEKRVGESATVRDRGPWRASEVYTPGELTSDKGSAWLCKQTTMTRPGSSADWRMIAKGGKGAELRVRTGARP